MSSEVGAALHAGQMQMADFSHVCRATPEEVSTAMRRVADWLHDLVAPDDRGSVEIVLAEVLNNIAEHSYCGTDPGEIRFCLTVREDTTDCIVTDHGRELPDLLLSARTISPDRPPEIGELAEGGYGWQLIHALTSQIASSRRGSWNTLAFAIPRGGNPDGDGVA